MDYVKQIEVSGYGHGHVQGIAIDAQRKYMYISFTTELVKADMQGNVVGSVAGFAGHIGCIGYGEDGRVYGSLEYKHDVIGKDIEAGTGVKVEGDKFYIVIFDVDKIDRVGMNAETDGVATAVYLKEVSDAYADNNRYGCTGIDGMTFAPAPGADKNSQKLLCVSSGNYLDVNRDDNDYQLLWFYDVNQMKKYEKPLLLSHLHESGPEKCEFKCFVYTGNTTFGIQNLEYDPDTGYMFAAVYPGKKPQFPNYPMFVIDRNSPLVKNCPLKGMNMVQDTLPLARVGEYHPQSDMYGYRFPLGSTGMIALGDGYFYFSDDYVRDGRHGTVIRLYRYDAARGFVEA